MVNAINSALNDENEEWIVPPHDCPTGECKWDHYYTLAACAHCEDITHLLTTNCTEYKPADANSTASGGCEVSLPNGLSTFNSIEGMDRTNWDPARNLMVTSSSHTPLFYTNYTGHMATAQAIFALNPDEPPTDFQNKTTPIKPYMITKDSNPIARECAIIPCVQQQNFTLKSRPNSNVLIPTMIIEQQWDRYTTGVEQIENYTYPWALVDFPVANMTKGTKQLQTWTESVDSNYFGRQTYMELRGILPTYLDTITFTRYNSTSTSEIQSVHQYDNYSLESPEATAILRNSHPGRWNQTYCIEADNVTTMPDFVCAMHKLAAGITNGMRIPEWEYIPSQRPKAEGVMETPTQICFAQWQYISAPIAVWVLSLVLFIGVVVKTRRANIKTWRTSPLATLLLRLDPDSREHLKDWQRMGDAELRVMAEQLRLRLRVDGDGPPRFVKE